jgi:hypothetical protein
MNEAAVEAPWREETLRSKRDVFQRLSISKGDKVDRHCARHGLSGCCGGHTHNSRAGMVFSSRDDSAQQPWSKQLSPQRRRRNANLNPYASSRVVTPTRSTASARSAAKRSAQSARAAYSDSSTWTAFAHSRAAVSNMTERYTAAASPARSGSPVRSPRAHGSPVHSPEQHSCSESNPAAAFTAAQRSLLRELDAMFSDLSDEHRTKLAQLRQADTEHYEAAVRRARLTHADAQQRSEAAAVERVLREGPGVDALHTAGLVLDFDSTSNSSSSLSSTAVASAKLAPHVAEELRESLERDFRSSLEAQTAAILREKESALLTAREAVTAKIETVVNGRLAALQQSVDAEHSSVLHAEEVALRAAAAAAAEQQAASATAATAAALAEQYEQLSAQRSALLQECKDDHSSVLAKVEQRLRAEAAAATTTAASSGVLAELQQQGLHQLDELKQQLQQQAEQELQLIDTEVWSCLIHQKYGVLICAVYHFPVVRACCFNARIQLLRSKCVDK